VTTRKPAGAASATLTSRTPAGTVLIDEQRLYDLGLRYEDLVAAVDVVVTKPGYGIIAECIANHTAMLYTPRGAFAEYDVLVEAMPRWLRCSLIDHAELRAGRWEDHVSRLLVQPPPGESPAVDGADVVADHVVRALAGTPARGGISSP
jgi:L-arabinokinase